MISRNFHLSCYLFFSLLSGAAFAQTPLLIRQEVSFPTGIKSYEGKVKSNSNDSWVYVQPSNGNATIATVNDETGDKKSVRFVAVTVKNSGSKPLVAWQVTEELEVLQYIIERSYNGSFFEEGGKVPFKPSAAIYNSYTYQDHNVAAEEEVYYRVKQVDSAGRYLYSQIVSLKLAQSSALQLVPNPAYDKTSVNVESSKTQNGWLQLLDPSGAVVQKQPITLKKGSNKLTLDGLQQFGNGTYYVQVVLPGGTLYKKLLLQ